MRLNMGGKRSHFPNGCKAKRRGSDTLVCADAGIFLTTLQAAWFNWRLDSKSGPELKRLDVVKFAVAERDGFW